MYFFRGLYWLGFTSVVAILSGCATSDRIASWDIPAQSERFHIFILMGQSNMVGCGTLMDGDREPVPHILMLGGECTVAGTRRTAVVWRPAGHPLHRLQPGEFGLGIDFAKAYLKQHPGVTVGLIPAAWGGTSIKELNKGTPIYQNTMKRVAFAQRQGVVKGVLWHQGESDTVEAADADKYMERLDQLVRDIRSDVGCPDLPFIAGDLAEFYGTGTEHSAPDRVARIRRIHDALRSLPARVSHTAYVNSTGLTSLDHYMVHFDRASLSEFGKRYALAYHTLFVKPSRK